MSTMNIAIVIGVVLLVVALAKMRRSKSEEASPRRAKAPRSDRRRRRRGKDAPPAPPDPMPLAAAAGQTAAASAPEPMGPPVAEWPPAEEPAPEAWPPADDASPVEWPPVDEPAAYAPPVADPFDGGDTSATWPEDELVTEPGWPMPGEVDVPWTPPAGQESIGMAPPAVAPVAADTGLSWSDEEAATTTPPELEWLSAAPADADEPAWTPAADESAPGQDFAWDSPAEAEALAEEPSWESAAAEPAWEQAEEPVWEPAAETAWQPSVDEPAAGAWEADPDDAQPTADIPMPFPLEDHLAVSGASDAGIPAWEADAAPDPVDPAPFGAIAVEEPAASPAFEEIAVATAGSFAPPAEVAPVAVEVAPLAVAPLEFAPEPVPAEAPEPPVAAPAEAWWDDEPAAAAPQAPVEDDGAFTGRFALGGFAIQPGQQALGGVTFRVELAEAPPSWTVAEAGEPVASGTVALFLDGTINCDAQGLEVVTDPGFAPTTQGFTVRVAALAAGPFAASGTFRVH